MNLSNNFNYAGLPSSGSSGPIDVEVINNVNVNPTSYAPSGVKYVSFADEFSTWRTIPKKTLPNPYGSGFVTVIPVVPPTISDNQNYKYFERRQLWTNPIGSGYTQKNVQLPVVAGKKWYLDTISFYAYDLHENLPALNSTELTIGDYAVPGITGSLELIIPGGWATTPYSIDAQIIGYNINDVVTWNKSFYTTADYPDFGWKTLQDAIYIPPTYPSPGTGRYGRNYETFGRLAQKGSRSGVVGGALTTDWLPNYFAFNISGVATDTGTVTGTSNMIVGSDQYTTHRYGSGNYFHTAMPVQVSNLNIEINHAFLGVEIYGPGYFHFIEIQDVTNPDDSVVGQIDTRPPIKTVVQFPIIAELIITNR
jgi:hypothetical protein